VRQKGFALVIIVLVLTLIGLLGYFAYSKGHLRSNLPRTTSITQVPLSTTQPTVVPGSKTTLKTYVNTKYNFEFQYPPNFEIYEIDSRISDNETHILNICNLSSSQTSFQSIKNSGFQFVRHKFINNNKIQIDIFNIRDYSESETGIKEAPAINHNDLLYIFDSGSSDVNEVDQILSTFKFTK